LQLLKADGGKGVVKSDIECFVDRGCTKCASTTNYIIEGDVASPTGQRQSAIASDRRIQNVVEDNVASCLNASGDNSIVITDINFIKEEHRSASTLKAVHSTKAAIRSDGGTIESDEFVVGVEGDSTGVTSIGAANCGHTTRCGDVASDCDGAGTSTGEINATAVTSGSSTACTRGDQVAVNRDGTTGAIDGNGTGISTCSPRCGGDCVTSSQGDGVTSDGDRLGNTSGCNIAVQSHCRGIESDDASGGSEGINIKITNHTKGECAGASNSLGKGC